MPITTSVLSPKYEVFCRRSVGCFSRRERSAHIFVIRVERATRKNSQLAPAQRVALKMGRRRRCSSVTYQFRYAPSYRQSGSDRLAGGPFLKQRHHHYMRDGALGISHGPPVSLPWCFRLRVPGKEVRRDCSWGSVQKGNAIPARV